MTITTNAENIAKLEAAGFNRWTKGNMDRLYINVSTLGLECEYYKTGNVRNAEWQGESISNADARRLMSSKVWIDVATGELHVRTDFREGFDMQSLEEIASAYIESILAPEPETEEVTDGEEIISDYIEVLDENEDTGETMYAVKILTGDIVSVIVAEDGTEYFNDDWQGNQPKSFEELHTRFDYLRWCTGDEIDF